MRSHSKGSDELMANRLRVFERLAPDGAVQTSWVVVEGSGLSLVEPGEPERALPPGALRAVFRRYGRPLDVPPAGARLALPDGDELVRFEFMPRYEVLPKTYLALVSADGPPLAELATAITAALSHLARAQAREG